MDSNTIEAEVKRIRKDIRKIKKEKRDRLKKMDFFCLDNSLRESTVGQLRSHTLKNKQRIYEETKKAGMTDVIVSAFAHASRVDDDFAKWITEQGEDMNKFFSFSEITEGIKDGRLETEKVPIALQKNLKYGFFNTFFEADFATADVKWGEKFTTEEFCQLILKWIKWVKEHHKEGVKPRNLINIRDFPIAMITAPERVIEVVTFLSKLPPEYKMFALAYEDPLGEYLPEELEAWTACMRRVMDNNGWADGKILVHIHQKWDLQTATQLDCLSAGADGVWASMCEEGAALGHACSSVTIMNLVRMGNKKVQEKYNCAYLRQAAQNITRITTGKEPHPKQPIYGARAADLVFGFLGVGKFDIAEFFGVEAPIRITSLATPEMIRDKLVNFFGENDQFTLEMGSKMKAKIMEDLKSNTKHEYMSKVGLALLFDRSGGSLTAEMAEAIQEDEVKNVHHQEIIKDIKELWDHFDSKEGADGGDDCLSFDSFYHGFMAPYFGCYRCPDTRKAFKAIDMDEDQKVDWNEFLLYIRWALRQHPELTNADETIQIAFEKGLIPAMRDEKLNDKESYKASSFRFEDDEEDEDD